MTNLRSSLLVGLTLRAVLFVSGSILTAPATAAAHPRVAPLVIAQQREGITSGGLYRPDMPSYFPRFQPPERAAATP